MTPHAIAGQEDGRGQADEAAAHHEDRDVTFQHCLILPSVGNSLASLTRTRSALGRAC